MPSLALLLPVAQGSGMVLGARLPVNAYGWAALLGGLVLFFGAIALAAGAFADEYAPPRSPRVDGSPRTYNGFAQALVLPVSLVTWGLALCVAYPLPTTPIFLVGLAVGTAFWRELKKRNP